MLELGGTDFSGGSHDGGMRWDTKHCSVWPGDVLRWIMKMCMVSSGGLFIGSNV